MVGSRKHFQIRSFQKAGKCYFEIGFFKKESHFTNSFKLNLQKVC